MTTETILKREDGSRVKISVRLQVNSYRDEAVAYPVQVFTCAPGKRTFTLAEPDDYLLRRTPFEERPALIASHQLQYVTTEEIHRARLQLWQLIRPGKPLK